MSKLVRFTKSIYRAIFPGKWDDETDDRCKVKYSVSHRWMTLKVIEPVDKTEKDQ